jgi:hypothetical protein
MGVVIEIFIKYPGGSTRMRVTDIPSYRTRMAPRTSGCGVHFGAILREFTPRRISNKTRIHHHSHDMPLGNLHANSNSR